MGRMVGTVVRGLRAPIIKQGDNMVDIVCETVIEAAKEEGYSIKDKDIVTITESIVARAQGNYATVDNIAKDVKTKFGDNTVGVIFPILSRNRFSLILKGISLGVKKVIILFSYPSDEVGNHFVSLEDLDNNKDIADTLKLSLDDEVVKVAREMIEVIERRDEKGDLEKSKNKLDDLQDIIDRKDAIITLSDNYTTFTGKQNDMNSSVTFVMKTDEIKIPEKKETFVPKQEEKQGFLDWVKGIFIK